MKSLLRHFAVPALVFSISAYFLTFGAEAVRSVGLRFPGQPFAFLPDLLGICLWLSAASLASRFVDVFFWDRLATATTGMPTPRLIRQLSSLLIYLLGAMGIVGIVFGQSVTGLLATSGAIGLVLGLALRSLILDLFSGIALNVESPFRVGEYINVQVRGLDPISGRVEEVNWRTTRILTDDNCLQVVPNSLLGASPVINYSRPDAISEFELTVSLDSAVDPNRVLSILNAALQCAVEDGQILAFPVSKARITGTSGDGVQYKLKYFIDPRQGGPGRKRHAVLSQVLRHLQHAGLDLAYPKQDILTAPISPPQMAEDAHRRDVLHGVVLFRGFSADDLESLAEQIEPMRIRQGHTVIRQGDDVDASMYVVVEGVLDVGVRSGEAETEVKVRLLQPGDFFGEMSLLTGAPRSATVVARTDCLVFRITKDTLSSLFEKNPGTVEIIAQTIAQRQSQNRGLADRRVDVDEVPEQAGTTQIMGRIRQFFGLASPAAPREPSASAGSSGRPRSEA